MDIKKIHPAFPQSFGEFSPGHKLRVAGIILGREALYSYLDYAELLLPHEERTRKRETRDEKIRTRVFEYLVDHDLPEYIDEPV